MRKIILLLFVLCSWWALNAQQLSPELKQKIESLKTIKNDTAKISLFGKIIDEAPDGVWEKYNEQLKTLSLSLVESNEPAISKAAKISLAKALNNEGYFWDMKGNKEKAIALYKESLKQSRELKDNRGIALSLNNIGALYEDQGKIELAAEQYLQSLQIREMLNEKEGIAESLNNLGFLFDKQGNFAKALEYFQRSFLLRESINDKQGMSGSLINIGSVYDNYLDDYEKAISFYRKSLQIQLKLGDKKMESTALDNIGVAHRKMANFIGKSRGLEFILHFDSALFYFNKSLAIRNEIDDQRGIAYSLNNIGEVYQSLNKPEQAETNFKKSLEIRRSLNDKKDIAFSLTNLGSIYFNKGDINKAKLFADEAYTLSSEIGFPENIKRIAFLLHQILYANKDYKKSLDIYKEYILMRDSIQNQETKKQLLKHQFQFEYDSKVRADSLIAAQEKKVVNARFKQEQTKLYALYGGVCLLLVFGGTMYNRFRVTQKQKQIIQTQMSWVQEQKEIVDEQKQLVDKKNKEILSSIEYAKRIQATILPPIEDIEKVLPDSFVLYLPKDIVAGDFYWMKQVQLANESNQLILIAACDSTGHGVPGAMVSVVCSKAMDKAVKEFEITEPSKILDKVAELVVEDFSRNNTKGDEIKDGMDASVLVLNQSDFDNLAGFVRAQWAGANNSLIIITPDGELTEIKADKQPIGRTEIRNPFTLQKLELSKGSCLYLYTDGYQDQFGGKKGKKLTKAKFKDLLISINNFPMEKQKSELQNFLRIYKGREEQVDDICIIGIRV